MHSAPGNITCTDKAQCLQCCLRQHYCSYCCSRRHKRCSCWHLLTECRCSVQHHDVTKTDSQTMRCLHYHDTSQQKIPANYWRAGAHTDFDTLTLLFQRSGKANELSITGRFATSNSDCMILTCRLPLLLALSYACKLALLNSSSWSQGP